MEFVEALFLSRKQNLPAISLFSLREKVRHRGEGIALGIHTIKRIGYRNYRLNPEQRRCRVRQR